MQAHETLEPEKTTPTIKDPGTESKVQELDQIKVQST